MVIIDTKTDTAHECVSKAEAARIIGVDRSTIHRWSDKEEAQTYNNFIVYFRTIRHKQPKGNGLPPEWRPPDYRRQ